MYNHYKYDISLYSLIYSKMKVAYFTVNLLPLIILIVLYFASRYINSLFHYIIFTSSLLIAIFLFFRYIVSKANKIALKYYNDYIDLPLSKFSDSKLYGIRKKLLKEYIIKNDILNIEQLKEIANLYKDKSNSNKITSIFRDSFLYGAFGLLYAKYIEYEFNKLNQIKAEPIEVIQVCLLITLLILLIFMFKFLFKNIFSFYFERDNRTMLQLANDLEELYYNLSYEKTKKKILMP